MKKTVSFAVLLMVLALCVAAFPRLAEHRLGYPVHSQPGWPAGLVDLLNSPGRVYGYWINGIDHYYYAGDTDAFNKFVKQYAELKRTSPRLTVHPGPGKEKNFDNKEIQYDWKVRVDGRRPQEDPLDFVSMEAWLGGQIELDRMKVPDNVKVEASSEIEKSVAVYDLRPKQAEQVEAEAQPAGPESTAETSEGEEAVVLTSEKPLYAKVVLNEDGSKVLSVMFDESQGTGKGYDVLYADVNFNGRFENNERFEKAPPPAVRSTGAIPLGWSSNTFQPIIVNVPYNEDGEGIPNPCEIVFTHERQAIFPGGGFIELSGELRDWDPVVIETGETTGVQVIRSTAEPITVDFASAATREEFSVRCLIRLRQDSSVWEYSFEGSVQTSESLESTSVWRFDAKPQLTVSTRPDGRNEGNLGIGLELKAGDWQFECRKGGEPPKAHVEIKRLDGTVVHEGDDDLGKFRFG